MANCTDSKEYMVFSRIRPGFKRELAFALKSQSESAGLIGRRRCTMSNNPSLYSDVPEIQSNKRLNSSGSEEREEGFKNRTTAEGQSATVDAPATTVEVKTTKKIPAKLKELLETGLLEGLPVRYIRGPKVRGQSGEGLPGMIKGTGVLCFCDICKGTEVVSPNLFEVHAGSGNKRPSDYIYLENGKTLRDILNVCKNATLYDLSEKIEIAVGSSVPKAPLCCPNCNGPIGEGSNGKTSLCPSCLSLKEAHHSSAEASDVGDNRSAFISVAKSSDQASSSSSQSKGPGKLTRKDLRRHKLVWEDGVLEDGDELGYYVRGKKLLKGYKKGSAIVCSCCRLEVSPSQFEAHAGCAKRRKPYDCIYNSVGISLHYLSIQIAKERNFPVEQNDDLCSICKDGGNVLPCHSCPRSFHPDCISLSITPQGKWHCRYCIGMFEKKNILQRNANAIAAEMKRRCNRRVKTLGSVEYGCVLCRAVDFSKNGFGPRTVIFCDQCEKEYHVGCLKEHNIDDLKELPKGKWLCCKDCKRIHSALKKLVADGEEKLPEPSQNLNVDIKWRVLSGRKNSDQTRLLLSKAVGIFHDRFGPISFSDKGSHDLIPDMLYGRSYKDQNFLGMHCAILTVNSSVVSAAIFRILGQGVAELPLAATSSECQGKGYFRLLFSCIENLLASLNVKKLVLPAADEAEAMWTQKFKFRKMTRDQLKHYQMDYQLMVFQGTSMLHRPVTKA